MIEPGPGEGAADLQGHGHAVLGLHAGESQGDGQGAGLADVVRDLQGVDVILGLDGRAGDDVAPEYFLTGNSMSPPNSQPPAEA